MKSLTAKFTYSERNIRILSNTIDKSLYYRKRVSTVISSVLLIMFGLAFSVDTKYSILCIAIGSIMFGSMNHRAASQSRQVIKGLNGLTPEVLYSFESDYFIVCAGKSTGRIEYSNLIKLLDDGKYLYIFQEMANAYMVPYSEFEENDLSELKERICEKSGLEWKKPGGLDLKKLFTKKQ